MLRSAYSVNVLGKSPIPKRKTQSQNILKKMHFNDITKSFHKKNSSKKYSINESIIEETEEVSIYNIKYLLITSLFLYRYKIVYFFSTPNYFKGFWIDFISLLMTIAFLSYRNMFCIMK